MNLENFLNVLPRLSKEACPDEVDMTKCLHTLVYEYFEPLYQDAMKKALSTTPRTRAGHRADYHELELLSKVQEYDKNLESLKTVYLLFFQGDADSLFMNPSIDEQIGYEKFVAFTRKLSIVPELIEKGMPPVIEA